MGKITDEQLRIIEKFSCERLSCRPENLDLIKTFTNKRGKGLVNYLQHCAWEEDVQGVTANYLIKSCTGEAVMFFSLKCGALFDPLDEKTIGCQYVFLFAADMSEDATLINYYNVALKFGQPTDISTNKPQYDLCCQFMCQGIGDLKKNQEEFFNNFNPDADDVIA